MAKISELGCRAVARWVILHHGVTAHATMSSQAVLDLEGELVPDDGAAGAGHNHLEYTPREQGRKTAEYGGVHQKRTS